MTEASGGFGLLLVAAVVYLLVRASRTAAGASGSGKAGAVGGKGRAAGRRSGVADLRAALRQLEAMSREPGEEPAAAPRTEGAGARLAARHLRERPLVRAESEAEMNREAWGPPPPDEAASLEEASATPSPGAAPSDAPPASRHGLGREVGAVGMAVRGKAGPGAGPTPAAGQGAAAGAPWRGRLERLGELERAVVLSELLGPPRSAR